MQAVGDIGIGSAGIEVEEEQGEVGVMFFVTVLNAFADDMVGDAAERLERDDLVDAVFRQVADFTGQEPSFAEVGSGVDDLTALTPDVHDVGEGSVEREGCAYTVIDMCVMAQQAVDEPCLPGLESVGADMLVAVDEGIRDGGGEEAGDGRRYDLHTFVDEPLDDAVVGERVVLDVDLADYTDDGHRAGIVGDGREVIHSLTHQFAHGAVVT